MVSLVMRVGINSIYFLLDMLVLVLTYDIVYLMYMNSIPVATAKTLRQADPISYPGPTNALAHLLKMYGPRGLFVGLVPAVLGSNVASAFYFGGYEVVCSHAAELMSPHFLVNEV